MSVGKLNSYIRWFNDVIFELNSFIAFSNWMSVAWYRNLKHGNVYVSFNNPDGSANGVLDSSIKNVTPKNWSLVWLEFSGWNGEYSGQILNFHP